MSELGARTTGELDGRPVLLVPLGSVEQHGPHLALDTDTVIARAIADRVAARRDDALVAPPVAYGSSGEHAGFAGTLSIGQDALELVVVELCRSATPDWQRHIVLVCGHGGNAGPLQRAVARLVGEGRAVSAWHPPRPTGGDAHAGRTETSVMSYLDPGRVRVERIEAGDRRPLAEVIDELRQGGVAAVSPNGVLGDPTGASAAEGELILAGWVDALDGHLAQVLGAPGGDDGSARAPSGDGRGEHA